MPRFWLWIASTCLAAGISGCGGRDIAGLWEGELPLQGASSCQIRLHSNGNFDFGCERGQLAGVGRFHLKGDILTLEWKGLTKNRKPVAPPNLPFSARVSGPGNAIELRPIDEGPELDWKRAAL